MRVLAGEPVLHRSSIYLLEINNQLLIVYYFHQYSVGGLPRPKRAEIDKRRFKGIWSFQILGIGKTMIATSTKNINTHWYIVTPNNVFPDMHFFFVIDESQLACGGMHWRIIAISPEIEKSTRNTINPHAKYRIRLEGKTRIINASRLTFTADCTTRYMEFAM